MDPYVEAHEPCAVISRGSPYQMPNGAERTAADSTVMPLPSGPYNGRLSRKLTEGLCGISTNTLVKYETEGVVKPERIKTGGRELVTYSPSDVQAVLAKRGRSFEPSSGLAEVIAIWSQKGGVGKSAFSQHISSLLALVSKKVLIIDLDSQGDCTALLESAPPPTEVLRSDAELDPTITELLNWTLEPGYEETQNDPSFYRKLRFDQVVKQISPNLHLIRSDLSLGEVNYSLNRLPLSKDRTAADGTLKNPPELFMIKDVIDELRSQYDFILFDCPPNIETLNLGCLFSCNRVIIPLEIEAKSLLIARRNEEFLRRLMSMNSGFKFDKVLIVPNKYENQTIKTKALWAVQEMYADAGVFCLSEVVLPSATVIDRCSDVREPIYAAATRTNKESKSWSTKAQDFTDYFWAIIHEVLDRKIDSLIFNKSLDQLEQ